MKKFLMACAALAFAAAPTFAQEASEKTEVAKVATTPAVEKIEKIEVNKDGSLTGNVFATVEDKNQPVDARVTLSSEGVVIEAVQAEDGVFSFANVAPGAYTLTGTAAGFTGGQVFDVAPHAGGCSTCNLGLQSTSDVVYESSPVYDAPVSACGSCGSTCGSCGGGGFGGGGFSGGGIGRRLLGSRPLLRAGLIGGVVAIAVSDDDDDDASADQ